MCVVSMVTQQFPEQFPDWQRTAPLTVLTGLQEVLKKLDAIDKAMEAKNCKDELKDQFFRDLAERIEALEKKKPNRIRKVKQGGKK